MSNRTRPVGEPLTGRGPYTFTVPALSPGETHKIDFRTLEYNGRKRYFKPYIPFDSSQITNRNDSVEVDVTYNNRYGATVVPNAIESFSQQGITVIEVAVPSGAASGISAGDVTAEVVLEPYDEGDQAREQASRGQISNIVEKFTGVRL